MSWVLCFDVVHVFVHGSCRQCGKFFLGHLICRRQVYRKIIRLQTMPKPYCKCHIDHGNAAFLEPPGDRRMGRGAGWERTGRGVLSWEAIQWNSWFLEHPDLSHVSNLSFSPPPQKKKKCINNIDSRELRFRALPSSNSSMFNLLILKEKRQKGAE